MKTVFCIDGISEDDKELCAFNSSKDAQAIIDTYKEEFSKKMSVEQIPEYEYKGRVAIALLFDLEDADSVKYGISNLDDEDRSRAYIQIGLAQPNSIGKLYADHLYIVLFPEENNGVEPLDLIDFSVFLEQMNSDLDSKKIAVDCEIKNVAKEADSERAFYDDVMLAMFNADKESELDKNTFDELSSLANKSGFTVEKLALMYKQQNLVVDYKNTRLEMDAFLEANDLPVDELILLVLECDMTEKVREKFLSLIDKVKNISLELNETQRRLDSDF